MGSITGGWGGPYTPNTMTRAPDTHKNDSSHAHVGKKHTRRSTQKKTKHLTTKKNLSSTRTQIKKTKNNNYNTSKPI